MSNPRALTFTVPVKTINELNDHKHWRTRQRRAKDQRGLTLFWIGSQLRTEYGYGLDGTSVLRQMFPCRVKFTRIAPGNGLDPGDGLPSAFKFVRDAVADLIGVDDKDPRYEWEYDQLRGKPGEYAVEIAVSPARQAPAREGA